jgi:hypothetical protein
MEEGIDEITKNYLKMVQWKINKYAQEVNESEEKLKEFWGQNSFYYYWYKILVDSPIEVKNDSGLDVEKLVQLVKAEQLYVYGAGKVAARIMELLENNQIDIDGVAVTDTDANPSVFLEKPVYGVDEILKYKETCTVLVGVGKKLRDEVVHNLMDKGFNNIVEIY